MYLNFSIFTVFLKNKNISSKNKRSKVTDYAALMLLFVLHWTNFSNIASIRENTAQEYDKHKFMNNNVIECEW